MMFQISFADVLVLITMMGGFSALVFAAGKLTARVETLEVSMRNFTDELKDIRACCPRLDRRRSLHTHDSST